MDVAEWLRGIGLERYVPAFRDNDIDGEVLRRLTAEDLRELGIASIGHRRRLLDAIAALGEREHAVEAKPVPVDAVSSPAERRQLTVMFCDLVGSPELYARLDPEDLREVIGAYHRTVEEAVVRFDGFVAKYMGDGVLAYFGYPQAHEDDAERAVRAGLGLIDAIARLDIGSLDLQARVGVATGLVVVGDLIGEGSAQEQSVVGETPNLAARLQALAGPDHIVIADNTRRQVGHLFEYEDLGEIRGQRAAGACARLSCSWREPDQQSVRGAAHRRDAARRARRRDGATQPPLGAGPGWKGPDSSDLRGAGYREIAVGRGVPTEPRRRASHSIAIFLLAASSAQRPVPVHRATGASRWFRAR